MNEILNQHNDLIDLPLRKFNASEIDILMALCYKCQNEGSTSITLTFDQISKLSHFKGKSNKRLAEAIDLTNKKLSQLNFRIDDDNGDIVRMVLFPTFRISPENETLTVKVNEDFTYLLNDFTGNYTALELQESAELKSSYAKGIYKKLRKFRNTGIWNVDVESFRDYLDVPKSYSTSDVDKVVIRPSLDELSEFFKGLNYEKNYEKKGGKGRPKVTGYKFSFKAENRNNNLPVNKIAELGNWENTNLYCPVCREKVYKKAMHNENGDYFIYGHPDFKTGKCSQVFTNATDCIPASQIEAEKESAAKAKNLTEEECKKNKNIVDGLLGMLFGR